MSRGCSHGQEHQLTHPIPLNDASAEANCVIIFSWINFECFFQSSVVAFAHNRYPFFSPVHRVHLDAVGSSYARHGHEDVARRGRSGFYGLSCTPRHCIEPCSRRCAWSQLPQGGRRSAGSACLPSASPCHARSRCLMLRLVEASRRYLSRSRNSTKVIHSLSLSQVVLCSSYFYQARINSTRCSHL